LLVPDGVGIVLAAKILGLAIKERVAGYEFFVEFSKRASEIGTIRYFFLGSTETVLQNIVSRMAREFPAIEIAGTLSPPFKDESSDKENQDMLQVINASKTDILWVGMTAPKQEKWIHANRNMLEVPLACGIGAVFDFFAGTKPRSAKWLQKLGLEWFPRFLREPQRLWRRNIISTPLFLMAVIRQRFSGVDGH
jgi:N-acetylglucosaminyldiphosphoundecaprenol N-acetyl-beta-D-mannosaminyltransferase